MENGATLTISGTGGLTINHNKLMAINGTTSTSLIVNDGANINIESTSENVGCMYLRKAITFNDVILKCSATGDKYAIDSEGTIKLIQGTYTIGSSGSKGIHSENYIYIGQENGEISDVALYLIADKEGIEAKKIEIYLGTMQIISGKGGISAASSGTDCDIETTKCRGNCACYIHYNGGKLAVVSGEDGIDSKGDIIIKGGNINILASNDVDYQPISQDGLLSITGWTVFAAGSAHGVSCAETTQIAKIYNGNTINSEAELVVRNNDGELTGLIRLTNDVNYFYFNNESPFTITIDNNEITFSEPSLNEEQCGKVENGGNNLISLNLIIFIIAIFGF